MAIDSLLIVPDRTKPRALQTAEEIAAWAAGHGLPVWTKDGHDEQLRPSLIVALGGDRTMMRTARQFPGILLLGINFGRVGFLATTEHREWRTALERVLAGDYTVREGPTLIARLQPTGELFAGAINDFVLRAPRGVVEVELYVDRDFVNVYPGDGIIVSTPQGSTAYALNAGGPIVVPGVRGLVVVPICAGPAIDRGLIAPETATIELLVRGRHPCELALDGETLTTLEPGHRLAVDAGPATFRSVTFPEHNYFAALRQKLNYTIRPHYRPFRPDEPGQSREPGTK